MTDTRSAADESAAPRAGAASPSEPNVEVIARLEADALQQRKLSERVSAAITKTTGNIRFVLVHVLLFACWVAWNLRLAPGATVFDPFPFGILTLIVSAEGVLLAIFVLISQNRAARLADRRAHLDLQVSLLSEQEMTKVLQMLERLCRHFNLTIEKADEVRQLMEKTDVHAIVTELEEKLPSD